MRAIEALSTITVTLALFVLSGCVPSGNGGDSVHDEEGVQEAFAAYRTSILNDDGYGAFLVVDKRTRDYYDKMHRLSDHGSETETRAGGLLRARPSTLFRCPAHLRLNGGY